MEEGEYSRYAELLECVEQVLGSRDQAENWIREPALGLEGGRSIDFLASPDGLELIEALLTRMENGVYH
jgi:putative toxin-antitoxin system antitoxin component (TIGR02293 family)